MKKNKQIYINRQAIGAILRSGLKGLANISLLLIGIIASMFLFYAGWNNGIVPAIGLNIIELDHAFWFIIAVWITRSPLRITLA